MKRLRTTLVMMLTLLGLLVACTNFDLSADTTRAPLEPTLVFFSADSLSLRANESTTLAWKITLNPDNAASISCTLSQAPEGAVATSKTVACEATQIVQPSSTTLYVLEASSATQGQLLREELTITVTQGGFNQAPFVKNDNYELVKGGLLNVSSAEGVLKNDEDSDGDSLSASLVKDALYGDLQFNSDGSFSYQHDGSTFNLDSFTYTASDGKATSTTVTAFLKILDPTNPTEPTPNSVPVAFADEYLLNRGSSLSIGAKEGVLNNDFDAENDPLNVILVSSTEHGDLVLKADGSFNYTHKGDDALSDVFRYQISDGKSTSNSVNVTFIIIPKANTVPIANADAYSLKQGETLSLSAKEGVLANDSDADGDSLKVSLLEDVKHGSLELSDAGAVRYKHDGSSNANDDFVYQISDGKATATAKVSLSIALEPSIPKELRIQIKSGADDTEEYSASESRAGIMVADGIDLDFGRDSDGDKLVGLRFTNVTLPAKTKIDKAFIQFTAVDAVATSGSARISVYLVNDPDPAPFGTQRFALSSLKKTYISTWRPSAWDKKGEQGSKQRLDVSKLVQTALDHPSWKSGNALALILDNDRTGVRVAESYEGNAAAAAILVIETDD